MTPNTSATRESNPLALWATVACFGTFASLVLASEAFIVIAQQNPSSPRWLTWIHWAIFWVSYPEHRAALGASALLGFGSIFGFMGWVFWPTDKTKLYGDAKWATRSDVKAAGLLGAERGIIVGKWGSEYLVLDGDEPVEVAASTGTGKSQGIAIPNALHWHGSLLANDMKGELYRLTAGWRKKHGQAIYCVNLGARDQHTAGWNPLAYINPDINLRVDDIQRIAHFVVPGHDPRVQYWIGNARLSFETFVLYLLETPGELVTLARVREMCQVGVGLKKWATSTIKTRHEKGPPLSRQVVLGLMAMASWEDKYAGEVKETLATQLEVFRDPMVAAATSRNDFDLRQLRRRPMSIYLIYSPRQFDKLAPLVRLFYQQALDQNADITMEEDRAGLRYPVLAMMDEFGAIGPVPAIAKGLVWMRAYGFRLLALYQSRGQNVENYGQAGAKTLHDQFGCSVIFTPPRGNVELPKEYSTMIGTSTVKRKSRSRRINFFAPDPSHTESEAEHGRALMLPQEVAEMPLDNQIVVRRGVPPIYCKKILAATDKTFTSKILAPPPVPFMPLAAEMPLDVQAFIEQACGAKAEEVKEAKATTTAFTLEDLDRLDELALDDFDIDFSDIDVGEPPLSEEAIQHAVDQFFSAVDSE